MYERHYQLSDILIAQTSKKTEDKSNCIVVSSVLIILEKTWNTVITRTTTIIIESLIFSGDVIRLLFIEKIKYLQLITMNILSSNLSVWVLSLCPRILQDHKFNGEQNNELRSFYSRTSSFTEASK